MRFHILLVLCCIFVITNGDIVFPCITPDGQDAWCISLFECPHIRQLVGSSNPSAISFVKESTCGNLMVCCGTPKHETEFQNQTEMQHTPAPSAIPVMITIGIKAPTSISTNKTEKFKRKQSHADARKLLPTLQYCGLQHTDDRFYNSNDTALDEFPWLVHIALSGTGLDDVDRCAGVLINNLYVLTGGFCGDEGFLVRLGQYATNISSTCIEGDPNIPECSDPIIKVRIQERISFRNPKYGYSGDYNRVWLLRLTKKVAWSDFVRPICLPLNETKRLTKIDSLAFSGWGASNIEEEGVTKKRLTYDVVDAEVCYKASEETHNIVTHTLANPNVSFICVSPQKNNTSTACFQERGGPFMYSQRNQWFLEGLVINADSNCGKDQPVNGVRITTEIINWILDTIRP